MEISNGDGGNVKMKGWQIGGVVAIALATLGPQTAWAVHKRGEYA